MTNRGRTAGLSLLAEVSFVRLVASMPHSHTSYPGSTRILWRVIAAWGGVLLVNAAADPNMTLVYQHCRLSKSLRPGDDVCPKASRPQKGAGELAGGEGVKGGLRRGAGPAGGHWCLQMLPPAERPVPRCPAPSAPTAPSRGTQSDQHDGSYTLRAFTSKLCTPHDDADRGSIAWCYSPLVALSTSSIIGEWRPMSRPCLRCQCI